MDSLELATFKTDKMSRKIRELGNRGRGDDVFEAYENMLDYIISGNGSILLNDLRYKKRFIQSIVNHQDILKCYIHLINETTRVFIMHEIRRYNVIDGLKNPYNRRLYLRGGFLTI